MHAYEHMIPKKPTDSLGICYFHRVDLEVLLACGGSEQRKRLLVRNAAQLQDSAKASSRGLG